jgi:hypothetical protein
VGEWTEGEAARGAERLAVGAYVARVGLGVGAAEASKSGAFAVAAASPLEADCAVPSRTDGSEGVGPSMAHRRDSYFERIKDSILL